MLRMATTRGTDVAIGMRSRRFQHGYVRSCTTEVAEKLLHRRRICALRRGYDRQSGIAAVPVGHSGTAATSETSGLGLSERTGLWETR